MTQGNRLTRFKFDVTSQKDESSKHSCQRLKSFPVARHLTNIVKNSLNWS
jgi:hypothetical protein